MIYFLAPGATTLFRTAQTRLIWTFTFSALGSHWSLPSCCPLGHRRVQPAVHICTFSHSLLLPTPSRHTLPFKVQTVISSPNSPHTVLVHQSHLMRDHILRNLTYSHLIQSPNCYTAERVWPSGEISCPGARSPRLKLQLHYLQTGLQNVVIIILLTISPMLYCSSLCLIL